MERSGESWPAWQTVALDKYLTGSPEDTMPVYVKIQGKECQVREVVLETGIAIHHPTRIQLKESPLAQAPASPAAKGLFAQFMGVNGGPRGPPLAPSDKDIWQSISYVRAPITWGELQPNGPAQWNQAALEAYGKGVLKDREKGVRVLPVLCFSTTWAARKDAWSYAESGNRYDIAALDGRENLRAVKITNLTTGKVSTAQWSTSVMPPEHVADWENYVDRVVAFLAKPPCNVEYFQIWNEASDMLWTGQFSGFWYGGMDTYMQTIHLPAARIVKKYGAKVVYGGWPCNSDVPHFLDLLNKHHAWDTLDVFDLHYYGLSAWQELYDNTKDTGRKFGIWQTEVAISSRAWVPNNYPRFFRWALTHDWQPDRYKIFQFAYQTYDDPKAYAYDICFILGNRYSCHGKGLVTLGQLLAGPVVEAYDGWQSRPALRPEINEGVSSIEGFRGNDRIVLAVHLAHDKALLFTDRSGARKDMPLDRPDTRLTVDFPELDAKKVSKAWRVGVYGSKTPLPAAAMNKDNAGRGMRVLVPTQDATDEEKKDNRESNIQTFYVLLELAH